MLSVAMVKEKYGEMWRAYHVDCLIHKSTSLEAGRVKNKMLENFQKLPEGLSGVKDRNWELGPSAHPVSCAMYGQYNSGHSYMSVAAGHVYGYARGQYSTGLLGTGVQTHMT